MTSEQRRLDSIHAGMVRNAPHTACIDPEALSAQVRAWQATVNAQALTWAATIAHNEAVWASYGGSTR